MTREDNVMDGWLREALAAPEPTLSRGFDATVLKRARPARLTSSGRIAMTLYAVAAVAAAGWLMQDLPADWIAASVALSAPVAAALAGYARSLARA